MTCQFEHFVNPQRLFHCLGNSGAPYSCAYYPHDKGTSLCRCWTLHMLESRVDKLATPWWLVFFLSFSVRSLGKIVLISVIGFVGQPVGDGKSQRLLVSIFLKSLLKKEIVSFGGINCCCPILKDSRAATFVCKLANTTFWLVFPVIFEGGLQKSLSSTVAIEQNKAKWLVLLVLFCFVSSEILNSKSQRRSCESWFACWYFGMRHSNCYLCQTNEM